MTRPRSIGDGCHVVVDHGTLVLTTEDADGRTTHRIFLQRVVFRRLLAYGVEAYDCRAQVVAELTEEPVTS